MAKQDDWVRLTVRMPQDLYDRLRQAVAVGPKSLNAELVSRLEWSFTAPQMESPYDQSTRPLTQEEYQRHIKAIVDVTQADFDDLMKEVRALRMELHASRNGQQPEGGD